MECETQIQRNIQMGNKNVIFYKNRKTQVIKRGQTGHSAPGLQYTDLRSVYKALEAKQSYILKPKKKNAEISAGV